MARDYKNFFDILRDALPPSISTEEIQKHASYDLWRTDPQLAAKYALKQCGLINWEAYLACYTDVANAKIDPVHHFIDDGIFEGRKILAKTNDNYKTDIVRPTISIIIPNYNNSVFLNKCLLSVIGQTLSNIEIIFIDDCSTDNSIDIAESYAQNDKRIKIIKHNTRLSQHMARKHGVESSIGEYVMFLDSDDFLDSKACDVALSATKFGYDMVCFNTRVLNLYGINNIRVKWIQNFLNGAKCGSYSIPKLLYLIFNEKIFGFTIWNKIYRGEICRNAFEQMDSGNFQMAEDMYEFIYICTYANGLYKIDDYLYFYNFGIGGSCSDDNEQTLSAIATQHNIIRPLKNLCKNRNIPYYEDIKNQLLSNAIAKICNNITDYSSQIFYQMAMNYGVIETLFKLIDTKFNDFSILCKLVSKIDRYDEIKSIGIYYYRLGAGGVEKIILILAKMLLKLGYHVVIFVEEINSTEYNLPAGIKLIKIPRSEDYSEGNTKALIKYFDLAIQNDPIDILFHHGGNSQTLIWILLLLHIRKIPMIAVLHEDPLAKLSRNQGNYTFNKRNMVLASVDKVVCLSKDAEILLRTQNVDAEYIPNPLPIYDNLLGLNRINYNIAVIGRLADRFKQIPHCLLILERLHETIPNAKMTFIGDFEYKVARTKFWNAVYEAGLEDYVTLTGWQQHPENVLSTCSVLLSTSWTEGFALGIGEAMALGLPCVIYKLAIPFSEETKGIIQVEQGNWKAAADALAKLMQNQTIWVKASIDAKINASQFTIELYEANMLKLIENFNVSSYISEIHKKKYIDIIRNMAFYVDRHTEPGGNYGKA